MASDEKEVYLTIHHALNATALLYANRLERKQSCSLQKAVNTWLRPEGQPYSSSSPALGQSSSEVKPHLGAVVSTVPAAQPHPCCCNSCGLALVPLPVQCQQWLSHSQPFQEPALEPARLKWAAAHSKTITDTDTHEKKEWKCLFWQPCGTETL